jgi:hypothetical protein
MPINIHLFLHHPGATCIAITVHDLEALVDVFNTQLIEHVKEFQANKLMMVLPNHYPSFNFSKSSLQRGNLLCSFSVLFLISQKWSAFTQDTSSMSNLSHMFPTCLGVASKNLRNTSSLKQPRVWHAHECATGSAAVLNVSNIGRSTCCTFEKY